MSIQAVAWALEQNIPNPGMKLVLISICNHAHNSTLCWDMKVSEIMREATMSKRSVQRHLKSLCEAGMIEVTENFHSSGWQTKSTYRVVTDSDEQAMVAHQHKCRTVVTDPAKRGVNLTPRDPVDNVVDNDGTNSQGFARSDTPRGANGDTPRGASGDTPIPSNNIKKTIGADVRAEAELVDKQSTELRVRRDTEAWNAWVAYVEKKNPKIREQVRREPYLVVPSLYPPETER